MNGGVVTCLAMWEQAGHFVNYHQQWYFIIWFFHAKKEAYALPVS